MRLLAVLALAGALLASGCTSDAKPASKARATTAAPAGSPCAEIWKPDAELPAGFDGCDGTESLETVDCADGSTLYLYSDIMFATPGGRIEKPSKAPMQDTEEFIRAYDACVGD